MGAERAGDEAGRLAAVEAARGVDGVSARALELLTGLMASVFGVRFAGVSLVDEGREWVRSLGGGRVIPREGSFCAQTRGMSGPLVVRDASVDGRFARFEQVESGGVRFYAGAPVTNAEGEWLGAVCVKDTEPREFGAGELALLARCAELASAVLAAGVEASRVREESARAGGERVALVRELARGVRGPLTAIVGAAEGLADDRLTPEERKEFQGIVHRNAERTVGVLGMMLDLVCAEGGGVVSAVSSVWGVVEMLRGVAGFVREEASFRGLEERVGLGAGVPAMVRADADRCRRLLTVLADEVVRRTSGGVVELGASWEGLGERSALRLTVRAERFRRESSGEVGAGEGVWMVAARVARAAGGDVRVVEGGYELVMPAESVGVGGEGGDVAGEARSLAGVRVLLVEDGAVQQRVVSRMLRGLGATVHVARDGEAALELARAGMKDGRGYEVVLMDLELPGISGLEATRVLRSEGFGGAILAMTASDASAQRERCREAGCDGWYTKPLGREALLRAVLSRRSAA